MKHKITIAFVLTFISIAIFWACKEEELPEVIGNIKVELTITEDSTSYIFAQLTCTLNETPKFTVENYGFCWDTIASVNIEKQSNSFNSLTSQNFQKNIESLKPNKTYYVKAYIQNGDVIIYSNELTIYTKDARPIVTTNDISTILANKAQCGGEATAFESLFPIIQRGVCWAKTQNPTIADSLTTDGTGNGSFTCGIQNLDVGINYYIRAYAINSEGVNYGEEKTFTTLDGVPELSTNLVTNITATSAAFSGNIADNDGLEILEKGFVWHTSNNPTTENNFKTVIGNELGSFNAEITGLALKTTFYVKAYLKNSEDTYYGNEISFTTENGLPSSLSTSAISDITAITATSGGNITDDGGFAITARGVCWNTDPNPEITNAHTTDGTGTGSFVSNLTSLSLNTTYYLRSYATNSTGTVYGNVLSFTTNDGIPDLTSISITNITASTATSGGNITDDGGFNITARGVCWSASSNPTIADNLTTDGTGTGSFTSTLTGLAGNTTYYVCSYATNSIGTTEYGDEINFTTLPTPILPVIVTSSVTNITAMNAESGGEITSDGYSTITEKGVCWGTSDMPTIDDNKNIEGTGIESFTSTISGLATLTNYYARAYAINEVGVSYGNSISFTTTDGVPEVETLPATNITTSSADCNGNVLNDGGFDITQNGICWSITNTDPKLSDNVVNDATPGTGNFTIPLSSLSIGTYYFKAFAINSKGTAYGDVETFEIYGIPNINEVYDTDVHDDDGGGGVGNGDSKINVGEEIDLEVEIKNNGTGTAYNIVGQLSFNDSSDDNYCNITDSEEPIASLAVGASIELDDFDFDVIGMPSDNELNFKLTVTYEDAQGNSYSNEITGGDLDLNVYDEILTTMLNPSDDAYVSSTSTTSVYNSDILVVENNASIRYSYIRFSNIPSFSNLNKAILRIYCSSTSQSNNTVSLYLANGSWSESSITWSNQPGYDINFNSSFVLTSSGQYFEIDIKNFVNEWMSSENNGLVIRVGSEQVVFNSSENSINKPELYLEYQK
jgi:hypothetical protein